MSSPLFPDPLTLLHNPRCSKSRAAKALLEERGLAFRERRYLDDPLTEAELKELRQRLGEPAGSWVRRSEDAYKDAGFGRDVDEATLLAAMVRHPVLIERPILIAASRAIVGRPPERIAEIL